MTTSRTESDASARPLPVIAVGGAPSSGTTLLADLLDAVPSLACPPELYVLCTRDAFKFDGAFRRAAIEGRSFPSSAVYAADAQFFNRKYLDCVGLDPAGLARLIEDSSDLADFMSRFGAVYGRFRSLELRALAEKTPININAASEFLDHFQSGVFVHLVRDGRAVVASLIRRGYSLYEASLIWMAQVHAAESLRGRENFIEVRFEDLIERPFNVASEVASLVGLHADPREIERRFRVNSYRAELPRIQSWSASCYTGAVNAPPPFTQVISSKNCAWMESIALVESRPSEGLSYLCSFAGLLDRYGYECMGALPTDAMKRTAACYREYLRKSRNRDRQNQYRLFLFDQEGDACLKEGADRSIRWVEDAFTHAPERKAGLTALEAVQVAMMIVQDLEWSMRKGVRLQKEGAVSDSL